MPFFKKKKKLFCAEITFSENLTPLIRSRREVPKVKKKKDTPLYQALSDQMLPAYSFLYFLGFQFESYNPNKTKNRACRPQNSKIIKLLTKHCKMK